jgi:hypothetical protein
VKDSALAAFWNRQNDHARVCLATASGALLTAAVFGVVSLYAQPATVARGLGAVGVIYLLLGVSCVSWRSTVPQTRREAVWRYTESRRFREGGPIAQEVWENN